MKAVRRLVLGQAPRRRLPGEEYLERPPGPSIIDDDYSAYRHVRTAYAYGLGRILSSLELIITMGPIS
jgi:hypothetical protein